MKAKVRLEESIGNDHIALSVSERATGNRDRNIGLIEISSEGAGRFDAIRGWRTGFPLTFGR